MTCQIHQLEYTTCCRTCRSVAARRAYYVRVNITYNAKLSKSATPTFRSQIDYFLALVDAGKP